MATQSISKYRNGFTLTELLIVIGVMILLFGVAVPGIGKLMNAGKEESAQGVLGAAIATARSFADRSPPMPPGVTYEGTALIVTPNEVRIVEHHNTDFSGGFKARLYRDVVSTVHSDTTKEIREGYVSIPRGVGLVGIQRIHEDAPLLLAPPFALRFDRNGHLIVNNVASYNMGTMFFFPDGHIFYDGNYDGAVPMATARWQKQPFRPKDYVTSRWDSERGGKVPGVPADRDIDDPMDPRSRVNFDTASQKYMLPFEGMETVIGVIAFNKEGLRKIFGDDALQSQATGPDEEEGNIRREVRDWLLENGRTYFFNRYSGAIIKP